MPANSDYSQWPVIVHKDLINSPISHLLLQKQLKFRTSSCLAESTIMFPRAKVSFLLVELTSEVLDELLPGVSDQSSDSDKGLTLSRIDKLGSFHGHPFVILLAPLFTSREFAALSELQVNYKLPPSRTFFIKDFIS
ncbi:hypothetical protein Btru_008020 [Bulinus truncatus]|nr:hypothetical protein Btru_008020 [Bulinus truncatus]